MKSLKGQLLLDGGKLVGSEFHHTVVLICAHDLEGAFGLVLNRVSEHTLANSLSEPIPEAVQELPLYIGGPVRPQAFSCLIHEPAVGAMTEAHVLPGLRLAHNLDELLEPSGDIVPFANLKFFAGYAGWSAGQLDNEMKDDAWLTHPASIDLIFHPAPEMLWKTILRGKGPKYQLLSEAPDDVSHN